MKTICFSVIAAITALTTGCAADPQTREVMSQHFAPVEVHQLNDMALTCDELSAGITNMGQAISTIDKQIAYHEQSSNSFSFISALASVSGAYAPNFRSAQLASAEGSLANAGAQITSNQGMTEKDLRMSYQGRHDALMQLYYGRNCHST